MAIYKLQGITLLLRRYRSTSLSSALTLEGARSSSFTFQGRMLSSTPLSMAKNDNISPEIDGSSTSGSFPESENDDEKKPSPSSSPKQRFPIIRMRWVVGSILTLLLSLWMPKWSTVLRIGGEAEMVIKEVEQVAEVVEKVATVAERVAEEVADQFPDQSKLKEAATLVEKVSKEAAKDAHLVEQIIHEVDSVKNDMENLETLTEPIISKIIHDQKHS